MGQTGQTVAQHVVLGIGNVLLTDDGVGVHVTRALAEAGDVEGVAIRDGGTIGLTLLAEIDPEAGLIAVDAMQMHEAPGTLRVYEDDAMTAVLQGVKHSAHEVALSDLIQAADLSGQGPARRALVAIQPEDTTWGLSPTPAVAAAVPQAVEEIRKLLDRWSNGL